MDINNSKEYRAGILAAVMAEDICVTDEQSLQSPHIDEINHAMQSSNPTDSLIALSARYSHSPEILEDIIKNIDFFHLTSKQMGDLSRKVLENSMFEVESIKNLDIKKLIETYKPNISGEIQFDDFSYFLQDLSLRGAGLSFLNFIRAELAENNDLEFELYRQTLRAISKVGYSAEITHILVQLKNGTRHEDISEFLVILLNNPNLDSSLIDQIAFLCEKDIDNQAISLLMLREVRFFIQYKDLFILNRLDHTKESLAAFIIYSNDLDILNQVKTLGIHDQQAILSEVLARRPEFSPICFDFLKVIFENIDPCQIIWFDQVFRLMVFSDEQAQYMLSFLQNNITEFYGYSLELYPLLQNLFNLGFTDEVKQIALQIISDDIATKWDNKKSLINLVNSQNIGNNNPMLISAFQKFIDTLDEAELLFFERIVLKYNLLSPTVYKILKGDRMYARISKDGSSLSVFTHGKYKGLIVNEIPSDSNFYWEQLHLSGIPVAPFLRTYSNGKFCKTISRYCGRALPFILNELGVYNDNSFIQALGIDVTAQDFNLLYFNDNELVKEIYRQKIEILASLKRLGINHGHPHENNFTIELIDVNYLNEHLSKNQVEFYGSVQRPNVNNIDYNSDYFSNDINKFYEVDSNGRRKWQMVIRLIDFDQARVLSED